MIQIFSHLEKVCCCQTLAFFSDDISKASLGHELCNDVEPADSILVNSQVSNDMRMVQSPAKKETQFPAKHSESALLQQSGFMFKVSELIFVLQQFQCNHSSFPISSVNFSKVASTKSFHDGYLIHCAVWFKLCDWRHCIARSASP